MISSLDKLDVSRKRVALAKTALEENEIDAVIFFDGDPCGRKFANTLAFTALILFPDKARASFCTASLKLLFQA